MSRFGSKIRTLIFVILHACVIGGKQFSDHWEKMRNEKFFNFVIRFEKNKQFLKYGKSKKQNFEVSIPVEKGKIIKKKPRVCIQENDFFSSSSIQICENKITSGWQEPNLKNKSLIYIKSEKQTFEILIWVKEGDFFLKITCLRQRRYFF